MYQMSKCFYRGIVNDPYDVAMDAVTGYAMCNQGVVTLEGHRVVMRRDHRSLKGKVKLMSGGGCGHEPGQQGCVGQGMLTAAVVGKVFRAPPPTAILATIRELAVDHPEGVLVIVLNYVNNRLNFGLAIDRARRDKLKVRMILVGDDCAVQSPPESMGRRGLCGFILYAKVAGAMAEEGRKLEDIYNALRGPSFNEMATLGMAVRSPNTPGTTSAYRIGPDEFELGVGIHGSEPGVLKMPATSTAAGVVSTMLDMMLAAGVTALTAPSGEGVAVLINNLGSACRLEAQVFAMEAMKQLAKRGVRVRRVFSGLMFTALDMCGMSITLMPLGGTLNVLKYLDAKVEGTAWPKAMTASCVGVDTEDEYSLPVVYEGREFSDPIESQGPRFTSRGADSLHQVLRVAAEAVMTDTDITSAQVWTNYDRPATRSNDARDVVRGSNVKKGAEEVLHALNSGEIDTSRPYATLRQLCAISEQRMCGLARPLYSLFFLAACAPFLRLPEGASVDARVWLDSLHQGIAAVKRYGRADKGDRTMLDPLIAAEETGRELMETGTPDDRDLASAMATAAEESSALTITMPVLVGGSRYEFRQHGDPGALCVAAWMRGVSNAIALVT